MRFLVLCVFCFDRSLKKKKDIFWQLFLYILRAKKKDMCVSGFSIDLFFHRLLCFWKRVHPKKMLQFPERKYCFLRLDFNTASLIPILTLNFTDLFMNFCNVGGEGGLTFMNEIKQTTLGILFIMTNSFLNQFCHFFYNLVPFFLSLMIILRWWKIS